MDSNLAASTLQLAKDIALSQIKEAIFALNNTGVIIFTNQAALDMVGFNLADVVGKPQTQVFHFVQHTDSGQNLAELNLTNQILKFNQTQKFAEATYLIKSTEIKVAVDGHLTPLKDGIGNTIGGLVIFRDITSEKQLRETEYNFVSIAAHQLRSPLGSLRWSIEMMLNGDVGELSAPIKGVLALNYENSKRMIDLVDDLLNISRIELGRIKDEPKLTNILSVVQAVTRELTWLARTKRINIGWIITQNIIPEIMIDTHRFRDVIENLIANAFKYNKIGGEVTISIDKIGDEIRFSVKDTGIGIPTQDQNKIFNKFFRATNAAHSEAQGTGLGLYVVKSYVEDWGGKVYFTSSEGVGSEFNIVLPINPRVHTWDKDPS